MLRIQKHSPMGKRVSMELSHAAESLCGNDDVVGTYSMPVHTMLGRGDAVEVLERVYAVEEL